VAANEAKPAGAPVEVEVRPTVFIGLGGTGMEILLRLRRRILQAEWNGTRLNSLSEFPVASFLYFDTDTNEARETGRAGATDPMADAVSFGKGDLLQKKVDVGYYQRNKANHPSIAEWLPSRDLSMIDTEKGAGQVRAISRLLFFDQFDNFRKAVSDKGNAVLDNVSTQQALAKLGIEVQRQLRAVVVGSIAGGTGSGAFIDAGLAIRSMLTPKFDEVDLFALLPSGYASANRDRVFANSFAALSELEHVMRPDAQPPYVRSWTSQERPMESKPYSEVFLFDTRNMNRDSTERVDDIFDMMADIMFEDFGSSEFARKKRSIAVNQKQHKGTMWHPPIGGTDQHSVLAYSRGYSAIGQSIVATTGSLEFEAAVSDASRTMLQAFFGVFEGATPKLPGVKDRDQFMKDELGLTSSMFNNFPEHLKPRPAAIPDYPLIDHLLVSEDGKTIPGRLVEDIASEIRAMREQATEPKDWVTQGEKIRAKYEAEVLAQAGTVSIRKREVEAARARLFRGLTAETGSQSLKEKLYVKVDDMEAGGLDFTIDLVRQIQEELAKPGTGVRARLEAAEAQFRTVAEEIMGHHLVGSLAKLERAAKPGFLGRVDRAAAEDYLGHFEADLAAGLKFRLRAVAAAEAQKLLDELTVWFGEQSAPDEQGEVTWSGFLRELDNGRRTVRSVLAMVSAEAQRVRDAANRPDSGVYIVINRGGGQIAEERIATEPKAWAREKFADFGGCRRLFPLLKNDADRLRLINQLRTIAKDKLAAEERRIPSAVAALNLLPPEEQRRTIERMLARAMPWIPTIFDRFRINADQFKMIIAAPEAHEFRDRYARMISDEMPKAGATIPTPTIEESGVRGRIICYCELSGFPLDALAPLRDDWRKAYEKELDKRGGLPLHNHEDKLRFPNPVVPTNEQLAQQRETLAIFFKALVAGILERGSMIQEAACDNESYYVDMSSHDLQSVGTERSIRRIGFKPIHLDRIRKKIEDFESGLGAVQFAALAALADWNARHAYTPKLELDAEKRETRLPGLGHQVFTELAAEYNRRARTAVDVRSLPVPPGEVSERLSRRIAEFTRAVEGSLSEVEATEANRDPQARLEHRATDKRMIDAAAFKAESLAGMIAVRAAPAEQAAAPAMPPPPPQAPAVSYYVAENGATQGPFGMPELREMRRSGRLDKATLVYAEVGGTDWVPAGGEAALKPLFAPAPPPPPTAVRPPPPPTTSH
jgi:hypothetical protein